MKCAKRNPKEKWTKSEIFIFVDELKRNIKNFMNEQTRRSKRVFIRMSKLIRNKTPLQCRNKFKELLLKLKDPQRIISHF